MIIIIAHTWQDIELTIETFNRNDKAIERLTELCREEDGSGFRKAHPGEKPEDYLSAFYEYVGEEQENFSDYIIAIEIIENLTEIK